MSPKHKLLRRLLEQYERGAQFGREEWTRDILLKLNESTFPELWTVHGSEGRHEMFSLLQKMEEDGLVRVDYRVDFGARTPLAVRMGRQELDKVESALPDRASLESVIRDLADRAKALDGNALPPWMRERLAFLARGRPAEVRAELPFSAERLRSQAADVADALTAAVALSVGVDESERGFSTRVFGLSKRFDEVRVHARTILTSFDPGWQATTPPDGRDFMRHYGMRYGPPMLKTAGAVVIPHELGAIPLSAFLPHAVLPASLAIPLASCADQIEIVTTIENETPFLEYITEAGGPNGLGQRGELVVYTAGYAESLLLNLLQRLGESARLRFRHWGDADLHGVRIWWEIRNAIGRPVELYRTTPSWVREAELQSCRPLTAAEHEALTADREGFAEKLREYPDARLGVELLDAVIDRGLWIEQEHGMVGADLPVAPPPSAL